MKAWTTIRSLSLSPSLAPPRPLPFSVSPFLSLSFSLSCWSLSVSLSLLFSLSPSLSLSLVTLSLSLSRSLFLSTLSVKNVYVRAYTNKAGLGVIMSLCAGVGGSERWELGVSGEGRGATETDTDSHNLVACVFCAGCSSRCRFGVLC